ncbi:pyruvate formate lyase family protein [Propionispora vibrioides]|uniref:Formate C-acetyltransferase n=1 Tax=Propionispora vibrioides TaxID=112903 RepID=A0A1H8T6H5_9FIRM|nr:pyruvate formate lyase family protein [Propionispora vibrioides]SEO86326.1 formate C-acetyltransferase [Propionispora vibrioides]
MNQRIENLKTLILDLNKGVREKRLYEYVGESLRKTVGEPIQIRRAKAFQNVMERTTQVVFPYELITGTMLGQCPLKKDILSEDERRAKAIQIIETYLDKKRKKNISHTIEFAEGHVKSFEENFGSKKSRWSLMARVHQDASIPYDDLQGTIAEMKERYQGQDIEPYEIGRELERSFKIEYDSEDKKLFDSLPYFIGNHISLNYERIVKVGLKATRNQVQALYEAAEDADKKEYYQAAVIAADATIAFIRRYAQTARAESEAAAVTLQRSEELKRMAEILDTVAEAPASNFYEATQLMWMLHIIANIQGGSALSLARIDQYLYPFYKKDLDAGEITEDFAKDLLACVWLKVNEPRMRTVESVTLGGVDREGNDAANDLTRICLQVAADLRVPYPNIGLRINRKNPDWLYDEAINTTAAGSGQPMLLNDEIWVPSLMSLGFSQENANDYYNMGCVELEVPGKQPSYGVCESIAFPVLIEEVMRKYAEGTCTINTFDDYMNAYKAELNAAIEADFEEAVQKKANMKNRCFDPYSSLLIDGCIENGKDMLQGGAELPMEWSVYAYGIGTAADSLYAVKKVIFEDESMTLEHLNEVLNANFEGYEYERNLLIECGQHYGNDQSDVDKVANEVLNYFTQQVSALNKRGMGDVFVSTLFGYFFHIYHGEIAKATPNGRKKGEPFSDSMGPSQGMDVNGPTRLLNSVLALEADKITGAFALSFKMNPSFFADDSGRNAMKQVLKTYIDNGGPQIQVYTTNAEDLQDAMIHPDKHRDLIVRVGGYCEFFVDLDRTLQKEILTRTMYGE